jgi:hypothetical protein
MHHDAAVAASDDRTQSYKGGIAHGGGALCSICESCQHAPAPPFQMPPLPSPLAHTHTHTPQLLVEAAAAFPNLRSVRIMNASVWPGDAHLLAQALLTCHGLQEVTLQQVGSVGGVGHIDWPLEQQGGAWPPQPLPPSSRTSSLLKLAELYVVCHSANPAFRITFSCGSMCAGHMSHSGPMCCTSSWCHLVTALDMVSKTWSRSNGLCWSTSPCAAGQAGQGGCSGAGSTAGGHPFPPTAGPGPVRGGQQPRQEGSSEGGRENCRAAGREGRGRERGQGREGEGRGRKGRGGERRGACWLPLGLRQ